MKIEMISIDELVPYEKNSRKHSDGQIAKVAASIKQFGFTNPILIDDDNIVTAGHCRLMAASVLGLKEVPTIRLSHLSKTQIRAYVIADNKLALESEWDEALLASEISDLQSLDFDVSLLGFESEFISAPFEPNLPQDDKSPEIVPSLVLRITLDTEDEQQMLFAELRDRGYKVKV